MFLWNLQWNSAKPPASITFRGMKFQQFNFPWAIYSFLLLSNDFDRTYQIHGIFTEVFHRY